MCTVREQSVLLKNRKNVAMDQTPELWTQSQTHLLAIVFKMQNGNESSENLVQKL